MNNPIENIKESNIPIKKNMESSFIDPNSYNEYQKKLEELSGILDKDLNNTDLKEAVNNLIESLEDSDNKLDGKISNLIGKLKFASLSEIPAIKTELQIAIKEQISSFETIQKNYEKDKAWIIKTTHESVTHEKQIASLDSTGLKEYQDELIKEIKKLNNDISNISNELQKTDNDFGENTFPNFIDSEEYMKNKNDIDNVLEMTYKAIQETIQYFESVALSDDLTMQLPGIEGEEGTLTFKTKADKLFYCKMFLETLKEGLDDKNSKWSTKTKILILLGVVTVVGGALVIKKTYLKIGILAINSVIWGLGKIPLIKNVTKKIPKIKTESSTTSPETKKETSIEKKGEFMTRERSLEIVSQFEKKYLEIPTITPIKYKKLSFEIEKLKTFINNGGLDKAKEMQLGEILNHLNNKKELLTNKRGQLADDVKWADSGKKWQDKNLKDRVKEGAGKVIQEKVAGKKFIIVPKIEEISNPKAIKTFIDDLGKAGEKIMVNFGGQEIEVNEKLEKLLQDIEGRELEFKAIEKAEGIKNLYDKSIIEKNKLETKLSGLNDIVSNTGKDGIITQSPNPAYTTTTAQLNSINAKIDKFEIDFVELNVGDINAFDASAEKTRLGGIIDVKIDELKTGHLGTKASEVGKIELDLKSTRINKIKVDLVRVLKRIKI